MNDLLGIAIWLILIFAVVVCVGRFLRCTDAAECVEKSDDFGDAR
jgi:hypothetical protein